MYTFIRCNIASHGRVLAKGSGHWLARAALALSVFAATLAFAGEADVIAAKATRKANGDVRFDVTVKSKDTGWDYYAERFEIVAPDGKVLATRVLLHPHEDEQPFTREVDDVKIPAGVSEVSVRALMKRKGKSANEKHDGLIAKVRLP